MSKKLTTAQRGNAGEHYANWLLHERGFRVYMADRNNPDHDMIADLNGRACFIRVKTTTNGTPRWTAKKDGKVFKNVYYGNDFVLIVDQSRPQAGNFDFYVVPTVSVENTLHECHQHFIGFPTKKGTQRKNTGIRALALRGKETQTNIGRGFEWRWDRFRNSFNAIVKPELGRVRKPKGSVYGVKALCEKYKSRLLNGSMSRKQLLEHCVNKGINLNTAKTQFAKWKSTQG